MNVIKQIAAYARVSSERQAQNRTIESQLTALRERAAQDGYVIGEKLLFVDDGYSGELLQRPALEALRDKAAAGEIDRVYIHSPDRLARRYAYQVLLLDEFRRAHVEVMFLNHSVDQSPEGELLLQVQGVIAEYERAKIMERCRRGRRQQALMGDVGVFGKAPFGYRYVAKSMEGRARFELIPEEVETARTIFHWFVRDGLAISVVCKRLNREKRPTRTQKTLWRPSAVWNLLRNPAYMGRARYGRTRIGEQRPRVRRATRRSEHARHPGSRHHVAPHEQIELAVPAIIDPEVFELAQERLNENRCRSRLGQDGPRHLLQGLVVCRQCGRALVHHPAGGQRKKKYHYYRCTGLDTHRWGGTRICCSRAVRAEHLEQAVWNDVRKLLADPQRLRREYERRLCSFDHHVSAGSEIVEKMGEKVRQGLERLVDAYQDGLISKEEFENRARCARERIASLQAEADSLAETEKARTSAREIAQRFEAFADAVHTGMDIDDFHTRARILRLLVKRIEVSEEEIRIEYTLSPPPADPTPAKAVSQDYPGRLAIFIPVQELQSIAAARAKSEEVSGLRILTRDVLGLFGKAIKPAAHVRRAGAQPDPHRRGAIQFRQRGQPDHAPTSGRSPNVDHDSSVARRSRSVDRSNPGRITRERPPGRRNSIALDSAIASAGRFTSTKPATFEPANPRPPRFGRTLPSRNGCTPLRRGLAP